MPFALDRLFGSRTRVKLLALFTGGTKRPYYIRELARMINERVNSVRRETETLRRLGILQTEVREGKKFYIANPKFPLLEELSQLFKKAGARPSDTLFEGLKKVGRLRLVVLTGFFTQVREVDTDILIVGTVRRRALEEFIGHVEREINRAINYTVMTENEFLYRRSMQDAFIRQIFEHEHVELINTLERVRS
jgi:hypothetical protein